MPVDEKAGPLAGAGDLETNAGDTADPTQAYDLVVETERAVPGSALNASNLATATTILAGLTIDAFTDPVARWAFSAVSSCIAASVLPTPMAVAIIAERNGIFSNAVRQPRSVLAELSNAAPPAALAMWSKEQVKANVARRRLEVAGQRFVSNAWRGEIAELLHLVQREAAAVLADLTAVVQ